MTAAELKYLTAIDELDIGIGGISLTAISIKMGVSKVSVYRAVERLEKNGYVKRDEKNKVVITPYGIECLKEYTVVAKWLSEHIENNCGVDSSVAREDAIKAACAMSDQSRRGLFKHMDSKNKHSEK